MSGPMVELEDIQQGGATSGDPICTACASQEQGSPKLPTECTCEQASPRTEFRASEFRHVAQLLRSTDDKVVRASLSNWLNAIIVALDIAATAPSPSVQS